jgi:hypothetical protein
VADLLAGKSEETVLGHLLGSSTVTRTTSFRQVMVTRYYLDLLRRAPTPAELGYWAPGTYPLGTIRAVLEASDEFVTKGR